MIPPRHGVSEVLEQARGLGFLGPGPVEAHVRHAAGFAEVLLAEPPERVIDLGSGAGVPGLEVARRLPCATVVLIDSSERRTEFLAWAVEELGWGERVRVLRARAEELGRDPAWRGWADAVVARGFGRPAVTAECAAPLLGEGGRLVVSEPPEPNGGRWPAAGLDVLGLRARSLRGASGSRYQELVQERPCPPKYPRRPGIPAKRPLF